MSEGKNKGVPGNQKSASKDSSVTIHASAIIEKLSQKSSVAYKPYDSLKGRYIKSSDKK